MIQLSSLIQKPKSVILIIIGLVLFGVLLISKIPIKLYPNTRKTSINVRIPHRTINAQNFERDYGEVVLDAVKSVEGIDDLEATFNNGSTSVVAKFEWGYDGQEAKAQVVTAMASIKSRLPEDSEDYGVWHWSGSTSGFFAVAAYSPELNSEQLYQILEPVLSTKLRQLKNVDVASLSSVEQTKIEIYLKPIELLKRGITPAQISRQIRSNYKDIPMGSFSVGRESISVGIKKDIKNIYQIENIKIAQEANRDVFLKDVAEVNIYKGLPRRLYSVNGKQAVTIFSMPDENGDIRSLAKEINQIIEDTKLVVPSHIKFQSLVDPGEFINRAIFNVATAGLVGGLLAVFITLIFLGEVRNTILIALSIPLSLVISFIFMGASKVSVNLISLGGLSLAIGMVVDSSIVVIENMFRHYKNKTYDTLFDTIIKSVAEVKNSIIASTLTSIVVFLPISFTSELTAAVLGDLSKTVIFVLIAAAIVALYITPCVFFGIFSKSKKDKLIDKKRIEPNIPKYVKIYSKMVGWLIQTKLRSITCVLAPFGVIFLLIYFVAPKIQREIMAKPESARLTLRFSNLKITKQEDLLIAIKPLEAKILEKFGDQIDNLFARIYRSNSGSFTMTLKDSSLRDDAMKKLETEFQTDKTWRFRISRWDPAELPLPRSDDLRISFQGSDPKVIVTLMDQAIDIIRKEKIYRNISGEPSTNKTKFLALYPREEILGKYKGVTLEQIASSGRVILSGSKVIDMSHEKDSFDIRVSYPDKFIKNPNSLMNFMLPTSKGNVPLKHFFDFSIEKEISEIIYKNGEKIFSIEGKMKESSKKWERTILEEKAKKLLDENLKMPKGYSYSVEDTQKDINNSIFSLLAALGISIILIYIILGIQFDSLGLPFIILVAVPLGLIGVILCLYLAGSTVSLNSLLGTILLGGISVNNSILMVDFFKLFRNRYGTVKEAILEATRLRVRPILITTLTTIFGMLPIALALGEGTNVIQPLGIAVSGGLGFSSISTLFVVPCLLSLFSREKEQKI